MFVLVAQKLNLLFTSILEAFPLSSRQYRRHLKLCVIAADIKKEQRLRLSSRFSTQTEKNKRDPKKIDQNLALIPPVDSAYRRLHTRVSSIFAELSACYTSLFLLSISQMVFQLDCEGWLQSFIASRPFSKQPATAIYVFENFYPYILLRYSSGTEHHGVSHGMSLLRALSLHASLCCPQMSALLRRGLRSTC